jgi:hypothetical protein
VKHTKKKDSLHVPSSKGRAEVVPVCDFKDPNPNPHFWYL